MTLQSKSEILNARFEGDELDKIKDFCFQNDLTKSELVRTAINIYIKIYPYKERIKTMISWFNDSNEKHDCL